MQFRSIFLASALVVCAVSLPAQAVTITDDYSGVWLPGVGGVASSTVAYGTELALISNVSLVGGGSFATGTAVEVDVLGSSWVTWAPDYDGSPYTGQVLWSGAANSIALALSGLYALGMQIEPNTTDDFLITMLLSSGDELHQTVNGNAGAKFFGFYGSGVAGLTITMAGDPPSPGFAFGNFRSVAAVPLPAALPLLAGAIGALGAFGHWQNRRRQRADAHRG